MTLHISISNAAEAALRQRAAQTGRSVESLAASIVDHAAKTNGSAALDAGLLPEAEAQRRMESIRQWARLARPYGASVDDSRESIYAERGG